MTAVIRAGEGGLSRFQSGFRIAARRDLAVGAGRNARQELGEAQGTIACRGRILPRARSQQFLRGDAPLRCESQNGLVLDLTDSFGFGVVARLTRIGRQASLCSFLRDLDKTPLCRKMDHRFGSAGAASCRVRAHASPPTQRASVYHHGMEHQSAPQIPDDITRVTESDLQADLTTFLDCVAFAEDELAVMRDGQPINE